LILASRNGHKLREFAEILPGVVLEPLPEGIVLPPEDGLTFEDNALIKARAARAATGQEVIADDSGLEVDGLGGRPGVRSARYAGESATDAQNLERVLRDLADSGGAATARYVCVVAWIDKSGVESTFRSTCEGRLVQDLRGSGGFGYDPAFVPDDTGATDLRTMAELSAEEKHEISHRGRAARAMAAELEQRSDPGEGRLGESH
jgi:XTP/dITP diphosphohydrolase